MDVGAVGGWSQYGNARGERDYDGVYAIGFKGKGAEMARAKETATTAIYQAVSPKSAPTFKKTRAKAKEAFKNNVTTVERWATQQGSAPEGKGDFKGKGKGAWGEGDFEGKGKEQGAKEFGELTETMFRDIGSGTSRKRRSRARR